MPWSRAVVAHPFFKLIDLTSSHTRALKAPHVSPLKSKKDLPNFDDVSEADAVTIAREFEQYAIVSGSRGGEARLVWTDAGPDGEAAE